MKSDWFPMKVPEIDILVFPPFEGFPREAISFLRRLKRNNNRRWFNNHKVEYILFVKQPMQSYIYALKPYFSLFAPEYDVNPLRSIFRPNRDVRFSSDKTPYKTHIAAHFVLKDKPKGYSGAGYYVEIGLDGIYVGGGIYMPTSDQLRAIRNAIVNKHEEFSEIISETRFRKLLDVNEWNKLTRLPHGFDAKHPLAEWLKYKQFYVGVSWEVEKCYSKAFVLDSVKIFESIANFVRFLNNI